jgi:uncharacterized SAM-binding protein YcdF (DUF218 family)
VSLLFKRVIASLLIPPGVFILAFFLLAVLLRSHRLGRTLALSAGIALYLLSIEPGRDLLLAPLERVYPQRIPAPGEAQAVVVLSGGTREKGFPSGDSAIRLLEAIRLSEKLQIPLLISGGIAPPRSKSDASVLSRFFSPYFAGITLYTEERSRDTRENAENSAEFLRKKGVERILLVTSAYHMPRAVLLFERTGLKVIPFPTDFKREGKYHITSFIPRPDCLHDSAKGIKEYLGLLYYAIPFFGGTPLPYSRSSSALSRSRMSSRSPSVELSAGGGGRGAGGIFS